MYEPIDRERLKCYTDRIRELDCLLKRKLSIERKIGLSGVDYSKIKVTTGNGRQLSEQERHALTLEKINRRISEYRAWVIPEHEIIKTQISRVSRWEYRKVLALRYLEGWKWSEITADFFKLEADFEEQKHDKYKRMVMFWNNAAMRELEAISNTPYIPAISQLKINLTPTTGGLEKQGLTIKQNIKSDTPSMTASMG